MNNRRCNTEECLDNATKNLFNLDLPVATVMSRPEMEWGKLAKGKVRVASRKIDVDWAEFSQDRYLFSHCTIVASVDVEKNGYHIKPACSELVNNNGNAWSNPVLVETFRSFVGAENYLEHVQIPELSKGKILDAVLRPVKYKSAKNEEADVFYVDILVATDRQHEDLVSKIASGELDTMSMGCLAEWVQCSQCGKEMKDSDSDCSHISSELMQTFKDSDGVERITAELCGRSVVSDGKVAGDPQSVKFIEASWVENPAFKGAVLNHYISEVPKAGEVIKLATSKLADFVDDLSKIRVADRDGMVVLRVAQNELRRRRREDMTDRIANQFLS